MGELVLQKSNLIGLGSLEKKEKEQKRFFSTVFAC